MPSHEIDLNDERYKFIDQRDHAWYHTVFEERWKKLKPYPFPKTFLPFEIQKLTYCTLYEFLKDGRT